MKSRKLIGAVTFVCLLVIGAVTKSSQASWDPLLSVVFVVAVCIAMWMTFYDRKNYPAKVWDFNPKRGLLYFFISWLIFPLLIAGRAFTGADFSLSAMLIGTLLMSILIGVAGIFTENVGV